MATPELIARFIVPLERLGLTYMVTGSVAAMGYGEPRMTNDVDVVVALSVRDADRLVAAYAEDHDLFVPDADVVVEAIRAGSGASVNVTLPSRALKADLFPAADELAAWGLARRVRVTVGGQPIWLAPAEYVVLRKLQYHRQGGSAKHLEDIRAMLRYSRDQLDLAAITDHAGPLGVAGLWRTLVTDAGVTPGGTS